MQLVETISHGALLHRKWSQRAARAAEGELPGAEAAPLKVCPQSRQRLLATVM